MIKKNKKKGKKNKKKLFSKCNRKPITGNVKLDVSKLRQKLTPKKKDPPSPSLGDR